MTLQNNSFNMIGAATSPPETIAIFTDQGNNGSAQLVPQTLRGLQLMESDGPFVTANFSDETVNSGLWDDGDNFLAAPTPVTLGKPGSSCNTFPSCRNAVFFINGALNIQYSIWGVDVPADAWDATHGINKTVGSVGDIFSANPAAVVSQEGTNAGKKIYVFAARLDTSLCPNGADDGCGRVYHASVTF
jgi:hypothetical protein